MENDEELNDLDAVETEALLQALSKRHNNIVFLGIAPLKTTNARTAAKLEYSGDGITALGLMVWGILKFASSCRFNQNDGG